MGVQLKLVDNIDINFIIKINMHTLCKSTDYLSVLASLNKLHIVLQNLWKLFCKCYLIICLYGMSLNPYKLQQCTISGRSSILFWGANACGPDPSPCVEGLASSPLHTSHNFTVWAGAQGSVSLIIRMTRWNQLKWTSVGLPFTFIEHATAAAVYCFNFIRILRNCLGLQKNYLSVQPCIYIYIYIYIY